MKREYFLKKVLKTLERGKGSVSAARDACQCGPSCRGAAGVLL